MSDIPEEALEAAAVALEIYEGPHSSEHMARAMLTAAAPIIEARAFAAGRAQGLEEAAVKADEHKAAAARMLRGAEYEEASIYDSAVTACEGLAESIRALKEKPHGGRYAVSKEWAMKMAKLEDGCEVGAGLAARDPEGEPHG